jgi:hypothetical protein
MNILDKLFPIEPKRLYTNALEALCLKPSKSLYLKHLDDDLSSGDRFIEIIFNPRDGTYTAYRDLFMGFGGELKAHTFEENMTDIKCWKFFDWGYRLFPEFTPDHLRETSDKV